MVRLVRAVCTLVTASALLAPPSASLSAHEGISVDESEALVAACVSVVKENGWPPFSIAVYDLGGQLKYFVSMDGAMPGSVDLAMLKGRTSARFPFSTRQVEEISQSASGASGLTDLPDMTSVAGGVPLFRNGKHIGGVGVSGALPEIDEQCAILVAEALAD